MKKTELVSSIAEKTGLSKKDCKLALEATLETIQEQLSEGNEINLVNFGKFKLSKRAPRVGRNPQTGKKIKIKAYNAPVFKAGKGLKTAVK